MTATENVQNNKSAKKLSVTEKKKLKIQLEGLGLCEKALKEIVAEGLGTLSMTGDASILSLSNYEQLARQFGDHYLQGIGRLFNLLICYIKEYCSDNSEAKFNAAADTVEKLYSLVKKSRIYINERLENGCRSPEDSYFYGLLVGENSRLKRLKASGSCVENARLTQLSLFADYDHLKRKTVFIGIWLELNSGKIYLTKKPYTASGSNTDHDSFFGVAEVPVMAVYPELGNARVGWDRATVSKLTDDDFTRLRGLASDSVGEQLREIKGYLQSAVNGPIIYKLIGFSKIGKIGRITVLKSKGGDTVALEDFPGHEKMTFRLEILPRASLLKDGTMLCGFFYNPDEHRIAACPLCIIPDGENKIVRLMY